jgi:curved DNA-binding protein CbpA
VELEFPTPKVGDYLRKIDAMVDETYYSLLGVHNAATDEQIRAAYRDLLKKIHPDTVALLSPDLKREAAEVTREIIEAYSVLSDPSRRDQYDRELSQHRQHSPPPLPPQHVHPTNETLRDLHLLASRRPTTPLGSGDLKME